MNNLKILGLACFLVTLLTMGLWLSKGMHLATPQQIEKVSETIDEFGDKVSTSEWVANPDKLDIGLDIAGPVAGVFFGLGCLLLWKGRKTES